MGAKLVEVTSREMNSCHNVIEMSKYQREAPKIKTMKTPEVLLGSVVDVDMLRAGTNGVIRRLFPTTAYLTIPQ